MERGVAKRGKSATFRDTQPPPRRRQRIREASQRLLTDSRIYLSRKKRERHDRKAARVSTKRTTSRTDNQRETFTDRVKQRLHLPSHSKSTSEGKGSKDSSPRSTFSSSIRSLSNRWRGSNSDGREPRSSREWLAKKLHLGKSKTEGDVSVEDPAGSPSVDPRSTGSTLPQVEGSTSMSGAVVLLPEELPEDSETVTMSQSGAVGKRRLASRRPRFVDSSVGDPQPIAENRVFVQHWEESTLPALKRKLLAGHQEHFVIALRLPRAPGAWVAEIMTDHKLPKNLEDELSRVSKKEAPFRFEITLEFVLGSIERCTPRTASPGPSHISAPADSEYFCAPLNSKKHQRFFMGDSVGCKECHKHVGTLGPLLQANGKAYWLVCRHIFSEEIPSPADLIRESGDNWSITHPANADADLTSEDGAIGIGRLQLHSGDFCKTAYPSKTMQVWCNLPDHKAETDWGLCLADQLPSPGYQNHFRVIPEDREVEPFSNPVTTIFEEDFRGRVVRGTGRTSGYGWGRVCQSPMLINKGKRESYSWFIEHLDPPDSPEKWLSAGLGIPGDSGAPIVDFETNHLLGQIWGYRFVKDKESEDGKSQNGKSQDGKSQGSRITVFSAISDIFHEVENEFGDQCGRPDLDLARCVDVYAAGNLEESTTTETASSAYESIEPSDGASLAVSTLPSAHSSVAKSHGNGTLE